MSASTLNWGGAKHHHPFQLTVGNIKPASTLSEGKFIMQCIVGLLFGQVPHQPSGDLTMGQEDTRTLQ